MNRAVSGNFLVVFAAVDGLGELLENVHSLLSNEFQVVWQLLVYSSPKLLTFDVLGQVNVHCFVLPDFAVGEHGQVGHVLGSHGEGVEHLVDGL